MHSCARVELGLGWVYPRSKTCFKFAQSAYKYQYSTYYYFIWYHDTSWIVSSWTDTSWTDRSCTIKSWTTEIGRVQPGAVAERLAHRFQDLVAQVRIPVVSLG